MKHYLLKTPPDRNAMVSYIPDLSLTFLIAAIIPLILGFIVGMIIKKALVIGLVIAAIILVLIVLGVVTPSQVLNPIASFLKPGSTGAALASYVDRLAGYLPWSSLTFIIGAIIGFLKG